MLTNWQMSIYHYDTWPKFVCSGVKTTVTVKPIGKQNSFPPEGVRILVLPLHEHRYPLDDTPKNDAVLTILPKTDGTLQVPYVFTGEQEYYLRFNSGDRKLGQVSVYCVNEDMMDRIPVMGDHHVHSMRSDGGYDPVYCVGVMRREGMDYVGISDHHNYMGSMEAIDAYADAPLDYHIFPSEEVQMPDTCIHYVSFGGRYSVNAMAEENIAFMEQHNDPAVMQRHQDVWQAGKGTDFPGTMTDDAFRQEIWKLAETMDIPEGFPRYVCAAYRWVCREIKKAGGLAIFAHPYRVYDTNYHVDERVTEWMLMQHEFDAYEVLGGDSFFEQNDLQAVQYYELTGRGRDIRIVGGSDSHRIVDNPAYSCSSTLVFSRSDSLEDIHEAIRQGYSLAVDWLSPDKPRLVGSYRLVKIGKFLLNHYFPIHDEICRAEGQAMLEYAFGDRESGLRVLAASQGRVPALWRKYFPGRKEAAGNAV